MQIMLTKYAATLEAHVNNSLMVTYTDLGQDVIIWTV